MDELIIDIKNFAQENGNEKVFRDYIIVQNEILNFLFVFFGLMNLSTQHYGCNVHIRETKLRFTATDWNVRHTAVCLTSKGTVQQGPADKALRIIPSNN